MANISVFDPQNVNTQINRLIRHLGFNYPQTLDEQNAVRSPALTLDVAEDDGNYWVQVDLPGVKKNDIRVNVDGNQVSISAEFINKIEDRKEKNIVHNERQQGRVARSFTLDSHIDESKTVARYVDGVLELMLPKRSGGNSRKQIAIQ